MPKRLLPVAVLAGSCLLLPAYALRAQDAATKAAPAQASDAKEKKDPIQQIKDEGLKNSQVMTTLSYLTDVIGPRLTASPNMKEANVWTRDRLANWGLENAHLEAWGPFGRGWVLERFSAQVVEPQCIPLIAYPKAWSPGTDGPILGEVVYFDVKEEADFQKYKGMLKGAIVLMSPAADVNARFEPLATRQTDSDLLNLSNAADAASGRRRPPQTPPQAEPARVAEAGVGANGAVPAAAAGGGAGGGGNGGAGANGAAGAGGGGGRGGANGGPGQPGGRGGQLTPEMRARAELQSKKTTFLMDEGAAVLVDVSNNGDGGTLFVAQASVPGAQPFGAPGQPNARRVSAWDKDAPKMLPQVTVSKEHYNRMVRMLKLGQVLKMAVEIAVKYQTDDLMGYNTIAEIPGTDLKDEIVMLGGHMDSWHSGTGATDNGAGVSVGMEAVRIIKTLDLKPRRTIRIGLWSGEEQGLMGSHAYVAEHFGQVGDGNRSAAFGQPRDGAAPAKLSTKPDYEKFSGYFNLDNGTGKVRGIYLQGNDAVRPIFRQWLTPFRDMGASTITIANTGGTDHQSFDAIGLPGFQFIQDVIEYNTRTHHSNQDVYDRIQADDMKQASVIMAAFVYNTAMRDEKLPRKPQPSTSASPAR
jgi:carboxypeptidase Q